MVVTSGCSIAMHSSVTVHLITDLTSPSVCCHWFLCAHSELYELQVAMAGTPGEAKTLDIGQKIIFY